MTMTPLLEVCVESVDGLVAAQEAGSDRVELCAALGEGGLTPSAGTLRAALRAARVPVHVMIRPRGGDFVYSEAEFRTMCADAEFAAAAGARGLVFGVLHPDATVDTSRTRTLVDLAGDCAVTFHRAFDFVRNQPSALPVLAGCGVRRVLTSGGRPTAAEGMDVLASLVEGAGSRLEVIGAGRIRPENVRQILHRTGLREIHFAPLRFVEGCRPANANIPGLSSGYQETDADAVRAMRIALDAA